jgi:hypothetical protein
MISKLVVSYCKIHTERFIQSLGRVLAISVSYTILNTGNGVLCDTSDDVRINHNKKL